MSKAVTDQRAAARKNGRNASVGRGGTAASLGLSASVVMNTPHVTLTERGLAASHGAALPASPRSI